MKTKRFILFVSLSIVSTIGIAQDSLHVIPETYLRVKQFSVNFLPPGFNYEVALGSKTTLSINPGLDINFSYSSLYGTSFLLRPFLDVQGRYYYNFERRISDGKNVTNNSANFVGVSVLGITPSIVDSENVETTNALVIGPVWGIQRTYKDGINLRLNLGLGASMDELRDSAPIVLIAGFSLGYVLKRDR